MTSREVEFTAKDGMRLRGTLRLPEGKIRGAAVILAGSGPTDRDGNSTAAPLPVFSQINLYREIAETLAESGIAVLAFDKRSVPAYREEWKKFIALNDTSAISDFFSFDKMAEDAQAAIAALKAETGEVPLTVIGHSEGGLIALKIADAEKPENIVLLATAGRSLREVLREQIFENVKRQAGGDGKIAQFFLDHAEKAMDALATGQPLPRDLPAGLTPLFNEAVRSHFAQILDLDPLPLAQASAAKILVVNGMHDIQVHHARDAEALDKALAKRHGAQHALVKVPQASHVFKKAADPADLEAVYGGPVAPELLQALKDFLAPPKPAPSPKPAPGKPGI